MLRRVFGCLLVLSLSISLAVCQSVFDRKPSDLFDPFTSGIQGGNFWALNGNLLTGIEFLGSTNAFPVEIRANNLRAYQLQHTVAGTIEGINVLGGHWANTIAPGVTAATIAGGGYSFVGGNAGANTVTANGGAIGGGTQISVTGGNGTVAGGHSNAASGAFGAVTGGSGNVAAADFSFVGGGRKNTAAGGTSAIAGGEGNRSAGHISFIGGGSTNETLGTYSGIVSGRENETPGNFSVIGGGDSNVSNGHYSFIGGGGRDRISSDPSGHQASGDWSFIGGGRTNQALAEFALITGGHNNRSSDRYAAVVGGRNNWAAGELAFVGGGSSHQAGGSNATVGGGRGNQSLGNFSAITGGDKNLADGDKSFIGGGQANQAFGYGVTIGGGITNYIQLGNSPGIGTGTIGGGTANFIPSTGISATIGGGEANLASGARSTIGGGASNVSSGAFSTVSGGWDNQATGKHASAPGGSGNRAVGNGSMAAGTNARAMHVGSFVWADDTTPATGHATTKPNQFLINAANVGVNYNTPIARLHAMENNAVGTSIAGLNLSASMGVAVSGICFNRSAPFSIGVYGATGAPTGIGVYGLETGGLCNSTGWAGYFVGDVHVTGCISASGFKKFKIDHPLDPDNRYLSHVAIESNEPINFYRGRARTDANGVAWIELPTYFQAINIDFEYSLTVIDERQFAMARVSKAIQNNAFQIRTDKPNIEVSWQVTARRNDPVAANCPFVAEEDKPLHDRGKYLNPEIYGQPKERAIGYSSALEEMAKPK